MENQHDKKNSGIKLEGDYPRFLIKLEEKQ